jgi:hypothetical protein
VARGATAVDAGGHAAMQKKGNTRSRLERGHYTERG